jgi:hypothetical protein
MVCSIRTSLPVPPPLTHDRTNSYWSPSARLRTPWLRQAVHPTIRLDCSLASTHWREAAYVRALWKGMTLCMFRNTTTLITFSSLSRIPAHWHATDGFTLESALTSAPMPTVKRHSPGEPLSHVTKTTTLAPLRNRKLPLQLLSRLGLHCPINVLEDPMMRTTFLLMASRQCLSTTAPLSRLPTA